MRVGDHLQSLFKSWRNFVEFFARGSSSTAKPKPFAYPQTPHVRKHGPTGWRCSQYRDWLRDEFNFRCVFCLRRERWLGSRPKTFEIDHLRPQSRHPELRDIYDNLLYTCASCNGAKSDTDVPDPGKVALGDHIEVADDGIHDGELYIRTQEGVQLVGKLRLDDASLIAERRDMIREVRESPESFVRRMQFPEALPDLAGGKQPPANTRPAGLQQSCHARRQRGELPEVY